MAGFGRPPRIVKCLSWGRELTKQTLPNKANSEWQLTAKRFTEAVRPDTVPVPTMRSAPS